MPHPLRARSLAAVLALLVTTPGLAHADDGEALIARGIELREKGKDDEALAVFRSALEKSPTPRARAQVALAEQALGMWVAAEADLVAALATDADPWIAKNRGPLEGALAVIRRHLGSLDVRGPDGAKASLDGAALGTLPAAVPFRVEVGTHRLEVEAPGYHPVARSVEIPPGGVARETVALIPLSERTPTAAIPAPPLASAPTPSGSDGHSQRVVGWVLAGTGAAFVAAGGGARVLRELVTVEYNGKCEETPDLRTCRDLEDDRRTWNTVSITAFVGGGVFLAGGLALVLMAPRQASVATSASPPGWLARLSCVPGPASGGAALACAGRF